MILKLISDKKGAMKIVEGTSVFVQKMDNHLDVIVERKRKYPDAEEPDAHYCIRNTSIDNKDTEIMWDEAYVMENGKTVDRLKF